jgi:DNA-binding CsgD family transcriptional regulator
VRETPVLAARAGGSGEMLRARNLLRRARTAAELRAAQSVLFPAEYGLSLRQTAEMLGCSVPTVSRLRHWLKAAPARTVLHADWGGRRRQNLSPAEERSFLNSLKDQARGGHAIAIRSIWKAYEAKLGRSVPDSTIYRLLRRHGWHKSARGAYHHKAVHAP